MSEKKKKALERELMDDLLEGRTVNKKRSSESENANEGKKGAQAPEGLLPTKTEALPDFGAGFNKTQKKQSASVTNDESTVRLSEKSRQVEDLRAPSSAPSVAPLDEKEVKSSVGRFGAFRSLGTNPAGQSLAASENLRIAQNRILELEQEVERLRVENEELAAAGETFRRKADELISRTEDLENRYQNAVSTHSQEKALLLENKESLRQELEKLRSKNEELELRISTNIQKIRVRERETRKPFGAGENGGCRAHSHQRRDDLGSQAPDGSTHARVEQLQDEEPRAESHDFG